MSIDFDALVASARPAGPESADELPANPYRAALLEWQAFWSTDHNAERWALEPLFAHGRGHAVYAPAKSAKSLVLLDVTARAALGLPALHRPGGEPLQSLYVDLEMTEADVQERLEDMGLGPEHDWSHFHYALLPSLSPLDTAAGGAELLEVCADLGAEFVVVDTLSRAIAGEENSADTLREFNRHTGSALKRHGVTWCRLDHAGKDVSKGARGTSAKADDVDVVWRLEPTEDGVVFRRTHSRIGWVPERVDLSRRLEPLRHEIGARDWPAGTVELAVELDRLDVPVELGERKARAHAKAADPDFTARGTRLRAAIEYRRHAAWDAP